MGTETVTVTITVTTDGSVTVEQIKEWFEVKLEVDREFDDNVSLSIKEVLDVK